MQLDLKKFRTYAGDCCPAKSAVLTHPSIFILFSLLHVLVCLLLPALLRADDALMMLHRTLLMSMRACPAVPVAPSVLLVHAERLLNRRIRFFCLFLYLFWLDHSIPPPFRRSLSLPTADCLPSPSFAPSLPFPPHASRRSARRRSRTVSQARASSPSAAARRAAAAAHRSAFVRSPSRHSTHRWRWEAYQTVCIRTAAVRQHHKDQR